MMYVNSDAGDPSPGLSVRGLTKIFPGGSGPPKVLYQDLDLDLRRNEKLAVLGRNGQGKSTLIQILGGILPTEGGKINWMMNPSWPLGFGGGFQGSLSGLDNIRFISRIYNRPYKEMLEKVDWFAELGASLKQPVKHYSSGMRARLAFGLSLAIEFDCYMIDEVVSVGDARFTEKCIDELFSKRGHRAFVIASHDVNLVRATCNRAIIIESGQVRSYDNVEEAIEVYSWLRAP